MIRFRNIYWTILAFVLLLPVNIAFAARGPTTCKSGENCLVNPIAFGTISEFLTAALNAFVMIAFPIVVLMIIYAGFLLVSAQGNEEKLKKAKATILWTIIGAIIVLGASVLVSVISGTVEQIQA